MAEVSELIGKTIINIQRENEELIFFCEDGSKYKMYHDQDCCESVTIDDINGDLSDLVGSPIILAKESTSTELSEKQLAEKEKQKIEEGDDYHDYGDESFLWTFYKLATIKGYVDIRWYGTSNGYYSETVQFDKAGKSGRFLRFWEDDDDDNN